MKVHSRLVADGQTNMSKVCNSPDVNTLETNSLNVKLRFSSIHMGSVEAAEFITNTPHIHAYIWVEKRAAGCI
jgi:hypothetical protein